MTKESQAEKQNEQLEEALEDQKEATAEQEAKAKELEADYQDAQKEIEQVEAEQEEVNNKVHKTRIGGTWVALILGILALTLLLIFILQNQDQVLVHLFAWDFTVPLGVGFLFAALFGALIMACVGALRMFQLRRQIRKRN